MEKRRAVKDEPDNKQETDRSFLDRNEVKEMVSDLMAKLTTNRPRDPFQFMTNYFDAAPSNQSNRLQRCHQTLLLAHHSTPAFQTNLLLAYEILSKHKVSKGVFGPNGVIFNDLLELLLQGLPSRSVIKVKTCLDVRSIDAISLEFFGSTIQSIFLLIEYAEFGSRLFRILDPSWSGNADKVKAEALVGLLAKSLCKSGNPVSDIEACFLLSPENIHQTLLEANIRSNGKVKITEDQFSELVCNSFVPLLITPV